jgi:hypothetical protein
VSRPRRTGLERAEPAPAGIALATAAFPALVALVALALAGCGVPRDDAFQSIGGDDIPYGLADTTSSTLTTTQPEPVSTVTTLPSPDPTNSPTTTLIPTEQVVLYFAVDDAIVSTSRNLTQPVTLEGVLDALGQVPSPTEPSSTQATPKLRSVVNRRDIVGVDVRGGVATVSLTEAFADLPAQEQRLAVAQVVLTFTERPGIGQVLFTVAGQPVDVPRADGSLARTTVSADDYSSLVRR